MGSASTITRRALVALVLAFGLVLMHGGIGSATACDGMTAMATTDMSMPAVGGGMTADVSTLGHKPGPEPVGAHSAPMCVSTPAMSSGGTSRTGPGTVALTPQVFLGQPQHTVTVSRATGREPPAPDVVSVLCVNRR